MSTPTVDSVTPPRGGRDCTFLLPIRLVQCSGGFFLYDPVPSYKMDPNIVQFIQLLKRVVKCPCSIQTRPFKIQKPRDGI